MRITVDHNKPNEARVLAELYRACANTGLRSMPKHSIRRSRLRLRADLAFYDHNGIVYALVKAKRHASGFDRTITKQHQKYASVGLPFRYCEGLSQIPETMVWLNQMLIEHEERQNNGQ